MDDVLAGAEAVVVPVPEVVVPVEFVEDEVGMLTEPESVAEPVSVPVPVPLVITGPGPPLSPEGSV